MINLFKPSEPLTPEQVFSSSDAMAYPQKLKGGIVYLTNLNQEQDRAALIWVVDGVENVLTPSGYGVRTTINEYGGKPFWIAGDKLYFSNKSDQCLYSQIINSGQIGVPRRITPLPSLGCVLKYTDVCQFGDKLIAIVERENKGDKSQDNQCFVAVIDPSEPDSPPIPIVEGADFYSNLVLNSSEEKIAWMQWNHPYMPWDQNSVYIASLSNDATVVEQKEVTAKNLGLGASFCQLCFSLQGTLFLSADFEFADGAKNYWNVYAYIDDTDSILPVTGEAEEFGYPHWQYGDSRIAQLDEKTLVTIASTPLADKLYLIDLDTLEYRQVYEMGSTIQHLSTDGSGTLYGIELSSNKRSQLVQFNLVEQQFRKQIVVSEKSLEFHSSLPEHIEYESGSGELSYGFFYTPKFAPEPDLDVLPPLIVMVHGGPTARAYSHFDIQKQFWLSNGFAILDVNHRGSSGYGRKYRDSLYSHWGEKDAADVFHGVQYLISENRVDGSKVVIRGKSAGGYAVLRALTEYPDMFKAGSSYYGIGNLATLAETTHKFEKHYTDRLVGEPYDSETGSRQESQYQLRSPSNYMEKVTAAMIIFQGEDDKIVPLEVAQEIVDNLEANGVEYQYIKYPNEGHGFRSAATNIDAWGRELAFYQSILNL